MLATERQQKVGNTKKKGFISSAPHLIVSVFINNSATISFLFSCCSSVKLPGMFYMHRKAWRLLCSVTHLGRQFVASDILRGIRHLRDKWYCLFRIERGRKPKFNCCTVSLKDKCKTTKSFTPQCEVWCTLTTCSATVKFWIEVKSFEFIHLGREGGDSRHLLESIFLVPTYFIIHLSCSSVA